MSPAEIVTFCRAVSVLGADHLDDVYWSGRTCLVSGHTDIPAYDAAFASFFLGSELGVIVRERRRSRTPHPVR